MRNQETNKIKAPLLMQLFEDPNIDSKPIMVTIDEYYDDICHSLECLLNTKRSLICEYMQEDISKCALIGYGIPDYSNSTYDGMNQRYQLCTAIEAAISHYEPRLTNISIQWEDDFEETERLIKIIIYATLKLNREDHQVSFESISDSMLNHFKVQ